MNFLMKKITAFYKRLGFFQGIALTLAMTSAISIATVNIPGFFTFSPGTPISASQINSNFDKLAGLIDNTRSQNYMGVWDASANSPDVVNQSAPNIGDYYIVNTAGSQTFTNGETMTFAVGDWVIYNGISWEKIHTTAGPVQWITTGSDLHYSTGKVGIGTSTPQIKLDVNGAIRVGADATACSAGVAGAMRFTSPNVEYCNGTAWTSFASAGGSVSSTQITDGTIVNADLSATANIDATKLGTGVIDNTEFGYLDGLTSSIQTQLNGKQASDSTLTALAAYNTNGIMVQTAADTFTARTLTGTANRLSVQNGDGVAGNPTINIPTALLPSPVVGDVGKFLKATAADTSVWTALSSADMTTALGYTPVNKAGDTISSGTIALTGSAALTVQNPVNLLDAVNKQYVDSFGQWTISGGYVYRSTGNVGIGTSAPQEKFVVEGASGTRAIIRNTDSTNALGAALNLDNFIGTSSTAPQLMLSNSRGNAGAMAAIQAGDDLGIISSYGRYDNTASNGAGPRIVFKSEGNWGTSSSTWTGSMNFLTGSGGNPLPRMTITSMGYIGIGTTSPTALLDINGGGMSVSGYVGIGKTYPSAPLDVYGNMAIDGNINATGVLNSASDIRLKKDIEKVDHALEKLTFISGVSYNWRREEFKDFKFEDRRQMGVIAQDVEKVFPEAVVKNQKGFRSVAYTMLIAPVIEAIKELNINKAEKTDIEELRAENAQMKEALCELGKKSFCR